MNTIDSRRRHIAAGLALAPLATSLSVFGQAAMPKTLTLLVPQNAGGSNDVVARAVAARLPQLLGGSNVVVENRPGAGGNVGSAWVAKSAPKDGSVWMVTVNSAQAVNPSLYKSTGFDPINDFEPVAGIAIVQHAIVVNPKFPANTLSELVALVRKRSGEIQLRLVRQRYVFASADGNAEEVAECTGHAHTLQGRGASSHGCDRRQRRYHGQHHSGLSAVRQGRAA